MLRNNASGPAIGFPGRLLAGLPAGTNRNWPSGRHSGGRRAEFVFVRYVSGQNPVRKGDLRPRSIVAQHRVQRISQKPARLISVTQNCCARRGSHRRPCGAHGLLYIWAQGGQSLTNFDKPYQALMSPNPRPLGKGVSGSSKLVKACQGLSSLPLRAHMCKIPHV